MVTASHRTQASTRNKLVEAWRTAQGKKAGVGPNSFNGGTALARRLPVARGGWHLFTRS